MNYLEISKLYGICHVENIASRMVLEKCGFISEYEGAGLYQGIEQMICRYIIQTKSQSELVAYNISNGSVNIKTTACDTTDRILLNKSFYEKSKLKGSFFSAIYDGKLRIHLVFNEETAFFNDDIIKLIKDSINIASMTSGVIWFRRSIESIISFVGTKFTLSPNMEEFYYYSTEYFIQRDKFNKSFDYTILEVKPYEERYIDMYLELLNDSMSFFIPLEDFVSKKSFYLQEFLDLSVKNAFEAFWKEHKLVGLYWINGTEVDTMGVSSDFQRFGYGSLILTRAIETIFRQNPYTERAILYCVGWNSKAQNFYKKYGMEISNLYKVPYSDVN